MSTTEQKALPLRLADRLTDNAEIDAAEGGNPDVIKLELDAAAELRRLSAENEALYGQLATERMRLSACGVVAQADTPESAAVARAMDPKFRSASCDDVARRVDECIALRAQVEALTKRNLVTDDYKQAPGSKNCMQCAAAYMLGLPLSAVPDFEKEGADAWESFYSFFASCGFTVEMLPPTLEIDGDYLASGETARGTSHMVVMRGKELLHDPHPDNTGLKSIQVVWLVTRKAGITTPSPLTQPVYLVATGEVHEGQETYTRHDAPVPMADQEVLFTRPPQPLTRPAVPEWLLKEWAKIKPELNSYISYPDTLDCAPCGACTRNLNEKEFVHEPWCPAEYARNALAAAPQPEVEVARTAVPVVISDDQIAATAGRLGGFSESRPLSQQWDNVYALVRKVIQERDAAPQPEATIKESSMVEAQPTEAAQQGAPHWKCQVCNGTGDVYDQMGEWQRYCDCDLGRILDEKSPIFIQKGSV
jgi:hypothetical protein